MLSVSRQLEVMPRSMRRNVSARALDHSTITSGLRPIDGPVAVVCRRSAGEIYESEPTPNASVVLRFFFGRCRLSVDVGLQWYDCGEAADGMAHVSCPKQLVRIEWLCDGEELVLTVPHSYWRERVTDGMRAAMKQGKLQRYTDPVLRQLVSMFVTSTLEGMHASFAAPLIDTMLARVVDLYIRLAERKAQNPHRNALPAFRMERVANYVREHLSETITLSDMAEAAGMSPMHFAALFREATGQRPHHYLLEQRVLHAKELMKRTSLPLYDIAVSTGFSTQAHFTTIFKRITGTTPGQWRFSRAL
jgi:AraC family transcriptional regulator